MSERELGFERRHVGEFVHTVFEQPVAEGVMKPLPLGHLCRLVWTVCFEAALYTAQTETSAEGPAGNRSSHVLCLMGGLRRKQD